VIVIDGIYYAAALAGAGVIVRWLAGPWFAAPLWLLAAYCLYFFRDPNRSIPAGPVAVAPADGKVVAVKPEGPAINRVSIFSTFTSTVLLSAAQSPRSSITRGGFTWPAAKRVPPKTSRTSSPSRDRAPEWFSSRSPA
jgi:hypothetical protein